MKNELLEKIVRQIVTEYMQGVLLLPSDALDVQDLSGGQINKMRKEAERLLKMSVFKHCVRQIVEQNKNVLLLQANVPEETWIARGQILGLANLEKALLNWTAQSKNSEISDDLDT
jgi:hypothetical protein